MRGRVPPLCVLRHVRERRVAKVLPARPYGLLRSLRRERGSADEALLRPAFHRTATPYALPGGVSRPYARGSPSDEFHVHIVLPREHAAVTGRQRVSVSRRVV